MVSHLLIILFPYFHFCSSYLSLGGLITHAPSDYGPRVMKVANLPPSHRILLSQIWPHYLSQHTLKTPSMHVYQSSSHLHQLMVNLWHQRQSCQERSMHCVRLSWKHVTYLISSRPYTPQKRMSWLNYSLMIPRIYGVYYVYILWMDIDSLVTFRT